MIGTQRIMVWDIGVRVFHWCLVVLFFVSYVTGEDESLVHIYAGYGVLALVVFRIFWGFFGSRYARFSDFIYGPEKTFQYLRSVIAREPIHYTGHNPLGGWMVITLLIFLSGVSWTGLELYGAEGHGPLAANTSSIMSTALANDDKAHDKGTGNKKEEEFWEEIHELVANITLLLVFMHIAGVVVGSIVHREKLVKAMITGYKDCDES